MNSDQDPPYFWEQPGWTPRNALESAVINTDFEAAVRPLLGPHLMTDAQLDNMFASLGFDPADFSQLREELDARCNSLFDVNGSLPNTGRKPRPGEPCHFVDVPGPEGVSIRMWDGGLERDGLCMLDFVKTGTDEPVNKPAGWEIYPTQGPNRRTPTTPFISWERRMGSIPSLIPEGQERFTVVDGVFCCLVRRGQDEFWFHVYERPNICLIPGVTPVEYTSRETR